MLQNSFTNIFTKLINDFAVCKHLVTELQIRAGQRSITGNFWPLTTHIFHVMITVTGGFSMKSFLLFPRNSFERLIEIAFLEFKHFYKTFSFYLFIFYSLLDNHSVYQRFPPFRTFPLRVITLVESVLFWLVVSQSLCILTLSTFCTFRIKNGTKEN